MSIKQVLKHDWLEEERAIDPDPGMTAYLIFLLLPIHLFLLLICALPFRLYHSSAAAVDTEEETLLLSIPRPHGRPSLQLMARKFEYPYLRDPDCTIMASSYRNSVKVRR